MKRIAPFLLILAVLGVALGSVWYLTKPIATSTVPASQPAPASTGAQQTPQQQTPPSQLGPVKTGVPGAEPPNTKGPANAKVHIEEFGDFQCPPCGMFHPVLEKMEKEFPKDLRVTFRHLPLPNHQHALRAASAAEAAGLQGKFWEMHALIYEHQQQWKDQFDVRPIFEGYAQQIGLDLARFNRDLSGATVQQRILQDGKRATSLGVGGTPTVFLNNREVPFQMLPENTLRGLIQQEIAKK
ncbi:MAG TPA: thioredoxin domain-containing protein [Pyrinomonadaceae bacterium]|nr:thioredoxin domain-containing protein [Pyrinomonadaceae bacterium]